MVRASQAISGRMTGTCLLCLCIVASLSCAVLAREPRGSQSAAHEEGQTQPLNVYWPSWMGRRRLEEMKVKEHSPPGKYYSQSKEDSTAEDRYFHNLHGGLFLEMGALDGVIYSNTKFFEDSRGWQGLLIEPKEEAFRALAGNRPNSLALNAAVCSKRKDVHFVTHGNWAVSGIWEFMDTSFKNEWYDTAEKLPESAKKLPCLPLGEILRMFGIERIDFFSLDVEGAELEVLSTLDFSKVHINVIAIEADGRNSQKDEAVRKLVLAHGFELDRSFSNQEAGARNDWFINKLFRPSVGPDAVDSV